MVIDGCEFREGLNAVCIRGGVAGNVIPDPCEIDVNFRFAPDRTVADAEAHLREVFDGYAVRDDRLGARGAARASPRRPPSDFLAAVGSEPVGKLGWTDVARFAALGIPALNFGPGDPNLAHTTDEQVEISKILDGRGGAAPLAERAVTTTRPAGVPVLPSGRHTCRQSWARQGRRSAMTARSGSTDSGSRG